MGAHIEERPDGLIIRGVPMLHGAGADSWNDHRVAMSLAIAATRSDGPVILTGSEVYRNRILNFGRTMNH